MIPGTLFWMTAGLLAGSLHAASLWRTARHLSSLAATRGMLRLLLVALLLVSAALAHGLLPVSAGWGIGFALTMGLCLIRSPR